MQYEVLTTWDAYEQIWHQLPWKHSPTSLFQEPLIQRCWWESVDRPEVYIIVVRTEGGKAHGVLPLCRQHDVLQLLGDQEVTDYQDAWVLPGSGEEVWKVFIDALLSDSSWRKVRLISIPESSTTRTHLSQALKSAQNISLTTQIQDVCPQITLPTTWEEYLKSIGKKQRHELTRKAKRLRENYVVDLQITTNIFHEGNQLQSFFTLHRASSSEKESFWTPVHEQYFNALARATSAAGWLRLYTLQLNGAAAASLFCFMYAETLMVYNSGYAADAYPGMSVGSVLIALSIEDAIAQGMRRYDFLRGSEEYKLRYGAVQHPVFNLQLERASDS